MRVATLALLASLLVSAVAPSAQAAGSRVWSADSTLAVVDASSVVETRRITYDGTYYDNDWTVAVPANATFREARDAAGKLLAVPSGDKVTVSTRGDRISDYSFTVVFDHRPRAEGTLVGFTARLAADVDTRTSVRVTLPAGWSLPGWFSGGDTAPDAGGVWRRTGPLYVDFLAAPMADPGPDARVEGRVVLREADALVNASGGTMELTYVYDTSIYNPSWRIPLWPGAAVLGARTDFGPLDVTVRDGEASLQTPFRPGYHMGARPFTLTLGLAEPRSFGGPFREVNLSLAAAEGDLVALRVKLDPALEHVGDRVAGGARVAPLTYSASGPLNVRVAFLPPVPEGSTRFSAGSYVVQAPRELEAVARATARNASELLPAALGFVGGGDVARPFHVAYTDADVFGWEEGFYTNGLDAISIRASQLRNVTDGKARLLPVSTLVHETGHGLVDRLMRESPDDLSLLHEGVSRLAETRIEERFPDEVVSCRTAGGRTECTRHSARPEPERLQAFLRSVAPFDPTWSTDTASESQRGFLYDYSGLVFHSYVDLAGEDALRHALLQMSRHEFEDEPAQDSETVLATLLEWAPGLSREMLLHPGRQVAHLSAGQFRACMGDLLPPPYPFEAVERAPASGCGWPSVAGREAPPPLEPTEPAPDAIPPPTRATPTTPLFGTTPTGDPAALEEPDAVPPADDVDRSAASTPAASPAAPVPALAPLLLVGLLALVALARRRAR